MFRVGRGGGGEAGELSVEAEWTVVPGDHRDLRTGSVVDVESVLRCSRNPAAREFHVDSELDMIVMRSGDRRSRKRQRAKARVKLEKLEPFVRELVWLC